MQKSRDDESRDPIQHGGVSDQGAHPLSRPEEYKARTLSHFHEVPVSWWTKYKIYCNLIYSRRGATSRLRVLNMTPSRVLKLGRLQVLVQLAWALAISK